MIAVESLSSFADDFFPVRLRELRIPGAVFAVVSRKGTILCRGYGLADIESRRKAEGTGSMFRAASVSKLFTATAALQLWEEQKLDLDEDVNRYLDFSLPDTFAEPVTARHLLIHTAGLDERYIGIAASSAGQALSLGEYLKRRMPARVFPPGQFVQYSNHGTTLLGYLVERISGAPFHRYVRDNIFFPLGMRESTFEVDDIHPANRVTGYTRRRGELAPLPVDSLQIGPAAGLAASASDMARFMTAFLNRGMLDGNRILKGSTVEMMQRRHFSHHPRLPGRALGFHERLQNGRRAVGHAGGMRGFSSFLFLLPAEGVGFYVAYNLFEPRLYEELIGAFLDRFFPAEDTRNPGPEVTSPDSHFKMKELAGYYRHNLYHCRKTFEKLVTLGAHFKVTPLNGNELRLEFPGSYREPVQLVGAGPNFFQPEKGSVRAAFGGDSRGRVSHMFLGTGVLEKLAWYEHARLQKRLFQFFTLFFTLSALGWTAAWPAALASTLNGAFLIGLGVVRKKVDSGRFLYGMPPAVKGLLLLPLLAIPPAVLLPGYLFWSHSGGWELLYGVGVLLVCGAFIPFLRYWNLLGFKY